MDTKYARVRLVIVISMLVAPAGISSVHAGWSPMDCPLAEHIIDVWGTSNANVFAVGHRGGIIRYDGDGNNDGMPDEIWEVMVPTVGVDNDLRAIWGASGTNIFTVGRHRVLNYNGSTWTDITSLVGMRAGTDLYNVWGSSHADVFAVGESGTIFHYNGSIWSNRSIATLSSADIFGIWGSSATDIFATNDAGLILYYNGTRWDILHSASVGLYGIWGTSESDVYAVGEAGTILHYDGNDWSRMDSGTAENFYRLWGASGTDIFVVGESGTILHYDGSWSAMASGTPNHLYGVWGSSGNDVFAVGESGTILHYVPDVITTSTTSVPSSTTTSASGRKRCAGEEMYGSSAEEITVLRCFRDGILSRTKEGQELINLYYQWSPALVKAMEEDEELREEIKAVIDDLMPLVRDVLE